MEERGRNQAPVINVANRATEKQSVAASIGATKVKRKQDIEVNRQTTTMRRMKNSRRRQKKVKR